jgi:hypothetical protein
MRSRNRSTEIPSEPIALVVRVPAREPQPVPGAPRLSQASGQLLLVKHGEVLAAASLQPARISRTMLLSVLQGVPQEETVYRAAGSVHGCALFRGSELWLSVQLRPRAAARYDTLRSRLAWTLHLLRGRRTLRRQDLKRTS